MQAKRLYLFLAYIIIVVIIIIEKTDAGPNGLYIRYITLMMMMIVLIAASKRQIPIRCKWTHHWWCHTWSKTVSLEEHHWIVIRFQHNIFGFLSIFMYLKDIKGDVQTVEWKYKQRSKCPRTDPLWIHRDRPVQATQCNRTTDCLLTRVAWCNVYAWAAASGRPVPASSQ